jgi:hypothetical protein
MLNVVYTVMLSLCMLSVIMQNVIMLSVMAPIDKEKNKTNCFFLSKLSPFKCFV